MDRTAQEALSAAHAEGHVDTDNPYALDVSSAVMAFDGCADLSAISVVLGNGGLPGMQTLLFHRGELIGDATEGIPSVSEIERVDDGVLRVTYPFTYQGESHAEASGRAVSTFTWSEAEGTVERTGDLPVYDAPLPEAASTPAEDPSAGSAAVSKDELYVLTNLGTRNDTTGFCFGSAQGVTCYGKHNNSATLPATGAPTSVPDLVAVGDGAPMGFEGPMPNEIDLAPGESHVHRGIACTATEAGFDCSNQETGAAISVAGPDVELTQPTR